MIWQLPRSIRAAIQQSGEGVISWWFIKTRKMAPDSAILRVADFRCHAAVCSGDAANIRTMVNNSKNMQTYMKRQNIFIHGLVAGSLVCSFCAGVVTLRAEDAPALKESAIPLVVYEDKGGTQNHYIPSGWMGNAKAIKMDEGCTENPHGGKTCLRFEYSEAGEWAGVVWQDPVNDWGDKAGGYNLKGAKKLTFWARGAKGDEEVTFKFGILGADKKFSDTASGDTSAVKLTKEWKEYTIDLAGKDMSRIKTGFVWSLAGQGAPVVFFLDDIRYE
jgi:hypothetical protein